MEACNCKSPSDVYNNVCGKCLMPINFETKPKAVAEVKRYERVFDEMIESSGGDYVLYLTYQSAIEKIAQLEGNLDECKSIKLALYNEAHAKIASLTAEVEILKEDIEFLEREKAGEAN